jgi:MerR family transcriptional regulator, light-induced transcriptional regulator
MIPPPTTYLRRHQQELAQKSVAQQYQRQPQLAQSYDEHGRQTSIRDTAYHLAYLAEAIEADDPLLFGEYLAWVNDLFANLNFPDHVLPTTLASLRQVLAEELPTAEKEAALKMLDAGSQSMDEALLTRPSLLSFIEGDEPLDVLARQFLDTVRRGDRRTAGQMILDEVQGGTSVKTIYMQVFQRTQREIGRLWQTNQVGVAEEHLCTAATQMIMSQLYPYIFTGERKDRRAVIACVGGELHEIGARMVADFLEMSGWDTYFLGANTPPHTVLQTVIEHKVDVLALSATMTFHVSEVTSIISRLRAETSLTTRVLVGGYPFNLSPDLWRKVGADGYAVNAETAVLSADKLIATRENRG